MKKIIILFLISIFANCNQRESALEKNVKEKDSLESVLQETKTLERKAETDVDNADTLFKKSQLFKINGVNCFWELTLFLYKGEKGGTGKLELRNQKNGEIILTNDNGNQGDYYSLEGYGHWHSFNNLDFELMNADIIKDVNFDGYKDFVIYNRGSSGSAGEFSDIYLFNPIKKTFERSKTLSGYNIDFDTIAKTVSFYARNGGYYNVSSTIHFNRLGKIKFEEVIERETIENNSPLFKITYKKIINDKLVKIKIDTVTDYQ